MKLNKHTLIILASMVILVIYGCSDMWDADLSKKTITPLSPQDSIKTSLSTISFSWQNDPDIVTYRLQVAYPSFKNPINYVLDTTIKSDHFLATLIPGTFEWRVYGYNSTSQTKYKIRKLTIDSTTDLSRTSTILKYPGIRYATNLATNTTFSWLAMVNASSYLFELSDSTLGTVLTSTFYTTNSCIIDLSKLSGFNEGVYKWSVIGRNNTTNTFSKCNTPFTFIYDITKPIVPTVSLPIPSQIFTKDTIFSWVRTTKDLSGIAGDSLVILKDTISNPRPIIINIFSLTNTYKLTGIKNGNYIFYLRSKDNAGNWGDKTSEVKFIVKKP